MSDAIHKVGETAKVAKGAADSAASRGSQGHIGLPQMILATGGGMAANNARHEGGAFFSHWSEYRDSLIGSTYNLGAIAESQVGGTNVIYTTWQTAARQTLTAAKGQIEILEKIEPYDSSWQCNGLDCTFVGYRNLHSPGSVYRACVP